MTDLAPGTSIALAIEKPAAGGRMIARHEGRVLLVSGVIPGEQAIVRVERIGKGVAYGVAERLLEASADRRRVDGDPLCGGCLYSHINYPRQLAIKGEVIADAFARIGRLPLPNAVSVTGSPREEGYRMRARLHVRSGTIGFFREGTHELCHPRGTRQLLPETCDLLERLASALRASGVGAVSEVELSENLDASGRAVHLDSSSALDRAALAGVASLEGLTGITTAGWTTADPAVVVAGDPYVTDVLVCGNHRVVMRRHVLSFFQGNRYLLQSLVDHVAQLVPEHSRAIDLYGGTGLFALTVAAGRNAQVIAVEGDRSSAADLDANAAQLAGAVEVVRQSVETFTSRSRQAPDVLIVDPPRTGLSREALDGVLRLSGRVVIYVSCDVATLARDARRLVDAGYVMREATGFDLFPNTPHVETVAVFDRLA